MDWRCNDLCMAHEDVDSDEAVSPSGIQRNQQHTKLEAGNLASNTVAVEPFTVEEALQMQGAGWEGDLEEMRTSPVRASF